MSNAGETSSWSPVFDPQTWENLLAVHQAKGDIFSAKTLGTILDGVQHLALARLEPTCPFVVTGFHASLFERLQGSFSNPALLKAVGMMYLGDFRMPGVALKHFELARQLAPADRDLDNLEKAATVALARAADDQVAHTPLDEVPASKPEVNKLIFKTTTRLHRVQTRQHLNESAGETERRHEVNKKTAALSPHTPPVVDISTIFDQIQQLIDQHYFADAFTSLAEATRAGAPLEDVQIFYGQLGLAAFDQNRLADALAAYLKMRDMTPDMVEGWFNCGLVYQKMGMLDEALDCYEQASRIDPSNASTWCNLSSILFEQGDFAESERTARQAISLRTDYARAMDTLAAALSAMNRLPEAAEVCQQAIRLQPSLHSAWFKLGVIKFQQENFVAAAEAFNLTGDNPDFFPYVLYYLCMINARRGRLDDSLEYLAQARAADPENELQSSALKEIGAVCTKLGRHATAADFYTQITELQPTDVDAWLAKGTAHHRINQYGEAQAAYQRVTELEPENPIPWHNLGILAADQELHEQARDCFQRETELAPEDPKAWYDLAVSWQALGDKEEGARAFQRAETLVRNKSRQTSDLSAAMSIVRRLNLGDRVLKTGDLG
jgi:tetratricopeptide (TPR) repeat protein